MKSIYIFYITYIYINISFDISINFNIFFLLSIMDIICIFIQKYLPHIYLNNHYSNSN